MQIGMMIAGGGLGGGEAAEAATGGAGEAATAEMAKQGVEKAMAEIAPKEFLEQQMANGGLGQYADLLGKKAFPGSNYYSPMAPGYMGGYF